jgi:outer membrane cobalamin receptor
MISLAKILSTIILICFISSFSFAQSIISGKVTENNGTPILGANVYLDGTYDGASSDSNGEFSFTTSESGTKTLIISFVSYESVSLSMDVKEMSGLVIKLREDVNSLDTVVISAGSFEASDNSKVSVLKPLDVVTTASALGDFVGALQTLPGTTTVAEDGRLFVRGGDANETQIFIDGIRVFTPYTPTTNNIPTRGRYSPFLFDGITFSTGGYSAEYGQALSSVLLLNTIDEPVQEKTDIGIMTVGLALGNTQKWKKNSLSINASYFNLAPYNAIFSDRNDWQKPFEGLAGEAVFRQQFENGLLKIYSAFDTSNFQLTQEDINLPEGLNFKLKNYNFYSNASYSGVLNNDWSIFAGASFTYANNDIKVIEDQIDNSENSAHLKLKFRKRFSNRFKLSIGADQFFTDFDESYQNDFSNFNYGFINDISGIYTEADYIFSKRFAVKMGVRGEYSELFDEFSISPRVSLAVKTGADSQLSLAYGDFYQQPNSNILKFYEDLQAEKTQHYILNYQYTANNRIFRAEIYRKEYSDLVTYTEEYPGFTTPFSNNGDGYAQGLDIFWRDNESVKNVDYWISYSYLDSERKYQNYPDHHTPPYANTHNLSVVAKYWIEDWKSQIGFSYQLGSGRTYTDPNEPGFLQKKTSGYNSLSINWAYLISQQKILYFSINNVLGIKNVNGYQYADTPNMNGQFERRTLRPAADQFFFVGFFWTLSDDGTDNQLDKL